MNRVKALSEILANNSFFVSIALISILFLVFYPSKFINIDEFDYARNAELLLQGELRQVCDPTIFSQFQVEDYCISKYNIGTSIFLIPATILGSQFLALTSLLAFVAGIWIFNRLLKEYKLNSVFTYLYALFPAFVFFSRTILSETYSATLVLASFYLTTRFLKSRDLRIGILAGLVIGAAVLVRYTNAMLLGVLVSTLLLSQLNAKGLRSIVKQALTISIGGLFPLGIFLIINSYLYGHALRSGYYYSSEEGAFIISQMPLFILRFTGILLAIYPGMLVVGFWTRLKKRYSIIATTIVMILLYAGFPNTVFEGKITDLILGVRFLIPVVPLLLFLYAVFLQRFTKHRYFHLVAITVFVILVAGAIAISFVHQGFLDTTSAALSLL